MCTPRLLMYPQHIESNIMKKPQDRTIAHQRMDEFTKANNMGAYKLKPCIWDMTKEGIATRDKQKADFIKARGVTKC